MSHQPTGEPINEQDRPERPVTVGYLKRLFERLQLSDDAVLYHDDGEWGWCSIGPEGQEIMFITSEELDRINTRAEQLLESGEASYGMKESMAFQEFKEQSGQ